MVAPYPAHDPHTAWIQALLAIAPVRAAPSQTDLRHVLLHARQRVVELAIPRRGSSHAAAAADVGLSAVSCRQVLIRRSGIRIQSAYLPARAGRSPSH